MSKKHAPPVQPGEKFCFCCAAIKPVSHFHRNRAAPDGFASQCKPCWFVTREAGRAMKRRIAAGESFRPAGHLAATSAATSAAGAGLAR